MLRQTEHTADWRPWCGVWIGALRGEATAVGRPPAMWSWLEPWKEGWSGGVNWSDGSSVAGWGLIDG